MNMGDRVRFKVGQLGMLESPQARAFIPDVVAQEGDEGVYDGPHERLPDWVMVAYEGQDGKTYWVPVHANAIEKV